MKNDFINHPTVSPTQNRRQDNSTLDDKPFEGACTSSMGNRWLSIPRSGSIWYEMVNGSDSSCDVDERRSKLSNDLEVNARCTERRTLLHKEILTISLDMWKNLNLIQPFRNFLPLKGKRQRWTLNVEIWKFTRTKLFSLSALAGPSIEHPPAWKITALDHEKNCQLGT